jgi:hypothetical protein
MKIKGIAILCAALWAIGAGAQNASGQYTAPEQTASDWSFSASAYTYIVPEGRNYVQPTVTADHRWLHLEARYNYEDLDTVSLWVGYNFKFGESDKISLEITPMIGGVVGNTQGIAPGLRGTLNWWRLELYGECEYVYATNESSNSFFYMWSEFTLSPVDWLRAGLVAQRTRAYESDLDIQRGFLVGLSYKQVEVAGYVFNPDKDKPTYVISVGVEF